MRTIDRARAQARRSNLPRIGSLLMLGVLVLLLSSYAKESKNWRWLTNEDENGSPVAQVDSPKAATKKEKQDSPDNSNEEPDSLTAEATPSEEPKAKPLPEGPTDLDPEQIAAIGEEFQALSDGSLKMLREEMPSYWRLFTWTKNQTAEQMLKRATTVSLDDMLQRPDDVRGKLVRVDLNLVRLLSYPAPENSAGVETVYEGWGWSNNTKQWVYEFVTPEIPANMPTGAKIHEKVTFVGYYFKVQGYHDANSKPNQRPLSAPLLVGRFIWHPVAPVDIAKHDPWWMWAIMGGIGVLVLVACVWPWIRPRTPPKSKVSDRRTAYDPIATDSADPSETYDGDDHNGPLSYLNGHTGSAESN